tara:strand:+ start:10814 stop:12949 length:2136 start_codon:yes stop_codon:yes gene_type:complete
MIKVIEFKKLKSGKKKYVIIFEKNGKKYTRKFGAQGMSDFTIHKDRERRERYISRHKKDLKTGDPMKPGYLSMYILWNKPSLKASLADYKRRLNVYNRTGKFPTSISGSKKLSFGAIIPFEDTSLNVLPGDIQNLIQRDVSSSDIQRIQRGRNVRKIPANMMTKKFLKQLLWRMNAEYESPEYATEQMTSVYGEPWLILNPGSKKTAQWLYYAADILTAKDFADDDFWYLCLEHVVVEFVDMNPDFNVYEGQIAANITASEDNVEVLLGKIGHFVDFDHPGWYTRALYWLQEEYATGNAFGKKNKTGGSKIPDNVVNKKLYASIKSKIKRSIKGRRWGAYDSGRLVREYKSKGGKYRGGKGKTNLGRWYKEKWVDACAWPKRKSCGRKTKEKIAYCRPSKKVDSKTPKLVQDLTKAQIKSRCAKKKRSPMKRVTKFGNQWRVSQNGNAYSDEIQFPGDVNWTIHCSYIKSIGGTHVTLRKNDGVPGGEDHSIHYGIPNWAPNGPPQWWATGELKNYLVQGETPKIPPKWQNWIINYYNTVCSTLLFPAQIRGPSPYAQTGFPPPSPAPGTGQGFLSRFGSHFSLNFYKSLMKSSKDVDKLANVLRQQLEMRCGKIKSTRCNKILVELYLNIFYAIKRLKTNVKEIQTEIQKDIELEIVKLKNKYKIIIDKTFVVNKTDFPKIKTLLYLLQDEVLDYTMDVAYLSSYIISYM